MIVSRERSLVSLVLLAGALLAGALGCSARQESDEDTGALREDAAPTEAGALVDGGPGAEAGDASQAAGELVDSRDGQTYRTITFGATTWLARNLAFETTGSYCYDDDPAACAKYGRLYTFEAAKTACPAGFHLGTDADWKALETALGMSAGQLNLEGYSTPRGTNEGTTAKDPAGFGAVMAGFRGGATYEALEDRTYFWTSSTRSGGVWRRRVTASDPTIFRFTNPSPGFAISVRCVMD